MVTPGEKVPRRGAIWIGVGGVILLALLVTLSFRLFVRQELVLVSPGGGAPEVAFDDDSCLLLARREGSPNSPEERAGYNRAKERGAIVELRAGTAVRVLDGRLLRGDSLLDARAEEQPQDVLINRVLVLDGPDKGLTACTVGTNIRALRPMP